MDVTIQATLTGDKGGDWMVVIRDQKCTTGQITVEDDCWIGANCVITAGVTIGRHAVVAAPVLDLLDVDPRGRILADDAGIEQLIARLEEEEDDDDEVTWDA